MINVFYLPQRQLTEGTHGEQHQTQREKRTKRHSDKQSRERKTRETTLREPRDDGTVTQIRVKVCLLPPPDESRYRIFRLLRTTTTGQVWT